MQSLFNVKVNWAVYLGIGILILLIVPGISFFSFFALMIALHQFLLVFYSIGYVIPVRYFAGSLMCLQMLVGPAFAYNGLDQFQFDKYKMKIPEYEYFSYAIPAVICFIIGLHLTGRLLGEKIDEAAIKDFVKRNSKIPYIFIIAGFLSSFVSGFFGPELGFVFYLLGSFKFIGLFMLLIGAVRLQVGVLILVFGSIVISSLGSAMFHDLVTWLIFLLAVLAIKYKPAVHIKGWITLSFIVLIVVIQQLKTTYRKATQFQGKAGGIEAFDEAYDESQETGSLFDLKSLARSNVRINQGFIVTNIMNNIPAKIPFSNGGELADILEAAFLPRIIAPNKLVAGDHETFRKYTGLALRSTTSMSISVLGDAYINFGTFGGCIFMMGWGWMFNVVLNGFYKFSKSFSIILLFTPLVFYFPIRPDTALQTAMGHLVKSCFLLYIMVIFWRRSVNHENERVLQPNTA